MPLKVFEREIDNPKSRYYRLFHGRFYERWLLAMMMPWHVVKPDLIIATSTELGDITKRSFAIPADRVRITGFPRNDRLLTDGKFPNDIGANLPRELTEAVQGKLTVFLYLPTFRDSNTEYMNIDWQELDQLMQRLGARFFFKTHPMDRIKNEVRMKCIVELPQELDVYSMLPYTDALISDYSSIIFDYMLLQRPIIYYTPDLASFINGSRSLNFDPSEIAIGPICSTFEQLMGALVDVVTSDSDQYSDIRKTTIPRIYKYLDARACERVLAAIEERQV